jgi:hypothetical protein
MSNPNDLLFAIPTGSPNPVTKPLRVASSSSLPLLGNAAPLRDCYPDGIVFYSAKKNQDRSQHGSSARELGHVVQEHAIPELASRALSLPTPIPPASAAVRLRSGLARFDYILVASMWLLTLPVFRLARLPYAFDLAALTKGYLMLPLGAFIVAIMLAVLGLPLRATLLPFFRRIWSKKALVFLLAPAGFLLCLALGPGVGLIVFIEALALAELSQRYGERFGRKLLDLLVPGVYLYFGLMAVFAFNHAIVGIRYGGTTDFTFNWLDSVLFRANVSSIAHWSFHHIPLAIFKGFDFIYFSIWSRLGAALTLVAVLGTRRQAIQFVRNLLICYSMALLVFAMVPAKGPYSICAIHNDDYPKSLDSYSTQQELISRMKKLYAHTITEEVREVGVGDYYISFPSLHAALPIIALWFLRRWKRIQKLALFLYCLLLPALVFLGWHYIVDILGGWGVAALSIAVTESISRRIDRSAAPEPVL